MRINVPNLSPERLREIIRHAGRAISGKDPDTHGIAQRYWSAVTYSLFESIFTAFLAKSRHEQDELGQTWTDLAPETKAYGRPDARQHLTLYDNRAVRNPALRVRPTLPPGINRQWGGRWLGLYLQLTSKHGEGDSVSKNIAGGNTWEYFKALGYPTLIGLTTNMTLPLMNRTGTLQKSLFPWPLSGGLYVPIDQNQVVRMTPGKLTIGTKLKYAGAADELRPLWPRDISVWLDRANGAGRDAVYEHLPLVIQRI
jgi:hypothetical protein